MSASASSWPLLVCWLFGKPLGRTRAPYRTCRPSTTSASVLLLWLRQGPLCSTSRTADSPGLTRACRRHPPSMHGCATGRKGARANIRPGKLAAGHRVARLGSPSSIPLRSPSRCEALAAIILTLRTYCLSSCEVVDQGKLSTLTAPSTRRVPQDGLGAQSRL